MLTGFDGDTPVLRPPARAATVRNLVTHTTGLGYWFFGDLLTRWEQVTGVPNVVAGSSASFSAPLLADPGDAFIYGINTDWRSTRPSPARAAPRASPPTSPTADPASSCGFGGGPGYKWGYGLLLNAADIPGMRRAWSGAWAGLCNTQFWVDRTTGVCASLYSSFLPFVTPEAVTLYGDFERALYAAL